MFTNIAIAPSINKEEPVGVTYDWIGKAGDGKWDSPRNWKVSGSGFKTPSEKSVRCFINDDARYINLVDAGTVSACVNIYNYYDDEDELITDRYFSLDTQFFVQLTLDGDTKLKVESLYLSDDSKMTGLSRVIVKNGAEIDSSVRLKLDDGISEMRVTDSIVTVLQDPEGDVDDVEGDNGVLSIGDSDPRYTKEKWGVGSKGNMFVDNSRITTASQLFVARFSSMSTGAFYVKNSSVVDIGGFMSIAGMGEGEFHLDASTLSIRKGLYIGEFNASVGEMFINNSTDVSVGESMYVGWDGVGRFFAYDSIVTIKDNLYIRKYHDAGDSYMEVNDATINIGNHLILNSIKDGKTEPTNGEAKLVLNGGEIKAGNGVYFNSEIGPAAKANVVLDGGILQSDGAIYLDYNTDGEVTITVNKDSTMISKHGLHFGKSGVGNDAGSAYLRINGGIVQAEDLVFDMSIAKVVYTEGELRILDAALNESEMKALIEAGRIDVVDAPDYRIVTANGYTVLSKR